MKMANNLIAPLKVVTDATGNTVALAEMSAGDVIAPQFLGGLGYNLDGGAITDLYRAPFQVDGGLTTDQYQRDALRYDGGLI